MAKISTMAYVRVYMYMRVSVCMCAIAESKRASFGVADFSADVIVIRKKVETTTIVITTTGLHGGTCGF